MARTGHSRGQTHETYGGLPQSEGPSERSFGLTVGSIFCAIAAGGFFFLEMRPWQASVFAASGVFLTAFGFFKPSALRPLNFLWTKLGIFLGLIATPFVMFLIFCTVFTPFGVVMRAYGYDPMKMRRKKRVSSYWVEREPPGPDPSTMREQF